MSAHLRPPSVGRSDVKVYVELATITAGETDREIDQVFCFHDAAMGYSSLIYSLPPSAGFRDFMKCAEQVFEIQARDERLPEKLVFNSPMFSLSVNAEGERLNRFFFPERIHSTAGLAENAEGDSRFCGAVFPLPGFSHQC